MSAIVGGCGDHVRLLRVVGVDMFFGKVKMFAGYDKSGDHQGLFVTLKGTRANEPGDSLAPSLSRHAAGRRHAAGTMPVLSEGGFKFECAYTWNR